MDWREPSTLLLIAVFLPLAGAVLMCQIGRAGQAAARSFALIVTVLTLVVAAGVVTMFPAEGVGTTGFAVTSVPWLGAGAPLAARFEVGLDGLGLWLFGLSALLMVTAVLASWTAIEERAGLFYGMLLLLEFGCLGVFVARDLMLFYVFFEFTLIPLFFLIGIWGSEERRWAAVKFFLFTLAGSVLTFLGLLAIVAWDAQQSGGPPRCSIPELTASLQAHPIRPLGWQMLIFAALFAGFAIKVPLFPLHTWLPLAHVQAPTAGSVILAGLLLKIGTYGFVRFSLAMLPEAAAAAMPWMLTLAVAGIVYGALVALAQTDLKRLIAYSSVSHLGFCMLGLFAINRLGMQGGTLQMVNHGLSTGALFALVGMLYERHHTREIAAYGGLASRMPRWSFLFVLFTMSSIGLPMLNGFVGEFLVLLGGFQCAWSVAAADWRVWLLTLACTAVSGVVLGAWYMLWLVERIVFGPSRQPGGEHGHEPEGGLPRDLTGRELAALLPLAVFVVWIGLQPGFFLSRMATTLDPIVQAAQAALADRPAAPAAVQAARRIELREARAAEQARVPSEGEARDVR